MRKFLISAIAAASAYSGVLVGASAFAADEAVAALTTPEKIAKAAAEGAMALNFDGTSFSGPGWDFLVREGAAANYFLHGEEHGIAENPKLAGALFAALTKSGYSNFAIEVSPPVAAELDKAAAKGRDGLAALFAEPGGAPAFYTMREEAEMLVAIKEAARKNAETLWGFDYEVGGDRLIIDRLSKKSMPKPARTALGALKAASDASWAEYEKTRNPMFIYSFAGDPALVAAVRDAWPKADAEALRMLKTLEETFAINKLWVDGKPWESNERRARLLRDNFLDYQARQKKHGKVYAKFGASHLIRGRSNSEVYDIGALIPELAEIEGGKSFSILVLPGARTRTAVLDPTTWQYSAGEARDDYAKGLEAIASAAAPDRFTVIDLRPLRPIASWRRDADGELRRVIHGYDAMVILSGSTPSANF